MIRASQEMPFEMMILDQMERSTMWMRLDSVSLTFRIKLKKQL